jgi:hypothetical protein
MPSDLELLARLEEGEGGGRVVLVARLPPRYRPERLLEELTRLRGVREVEWER